MVLSVLYGTRKYRQGQVISPFGSLTFDTVQTEEHIFSSRVTHYPVEYGTIISDHIIKEPDVVMIEGVVSDTPLNIFASFNRSVAAFNQLVELQSRRYPVDLVTGIKVYRNMAITSLNVPRNIKTGQTLTFNIEFQKIIYDDTIQQELNAENVFQGYRDSTPREIVKDSSTIPYFQTDSPYSLKDQAQTQSNVGVQSLATVPASIVANVNAMSLIVRSAL